MEKVARDKTLQSMVEELIKYNSYLIEFYGKLKNLNTDDKTSLINAINEALEHQKREPVLELEYNRNGSDEYIECTYKGDGTLSASCSDTSIADVEVDNNNVNITRHKSGTPTITVDVSKTDTYFSDRVNIIIPKGLRFGYRIKESESDPYARVEYLYDAEGMTPAKMLSSGTFDYGDWENAWFIKDNKPLMLNSDGTIAYYLNPNNYAQRENGDNSDIANTSFNGNAMAQMPLVWIKRYSENGYHYEIVSNVQYDSDYKAYAHTRMNGTIAPYFYYSMFGGSNVSNKLRSLSGTSLAGSITISTGVSYATANGSLWYTHTWSQREYIRTLLILLSKSTNSQAVFGNGNCNGSLLSTGTLNDKGQFYGSLTANNVQVKCFHIEKLWGDQCDCIAGFIHSGNYYIKMTREGSGYQIDNVNGYYNTGIIVSGSTQGYLKECICNEYGLIPKINSGGSATTYYCDDIWNNDGSSMGYLTVGGASSWTTSCGLFQTDTNTLTYSSADMGCGLSCEMPST